MDGREWGMGDGNGGNGENSENSEGVVPIGPTKTDHPFSVIVTLSNKNQA